MKRFPLYCLAICFVLSSGNAFSQAGTWVWVSGAQGPNWPGVYGTQGVPSVNNRPSSVYEPCEWKDKQGNFWIYGGLAPAMGDLWKYDPVTTEWTWVKGSAITNPPPVFGQMGIPDPANTPGQRRYCTMTWVDTSGNFWLMGGYGCGSDLWKYEISTNEWTWMKGDTTPWVASYHGIKGVPSPAVEPGWREETSSAWTDAENNLWFFGGDGRNDSQALGLKNDLMKYNISTNEWTWMSGSWDTTTATYYGTKGVSSPLNDPGGRYSYSRWKDMNGNFWIMGGLSDKTLNDVWRFNTSNYEWTWMSGTDVKNDSGKYISTCYFDSAEVPPARFEHRSSVTDDCGRFWLFGGISHSYWGCMNDLWVFDPCLVKWNWLSGSDSARALGSYGTLGVPSPTNMPMARSGSASWWSDGKFYLFGGYNPASNPLSDMWVYIPDSVCTGSCTLQAGFTSDEIQICPGSCVSYTNLSCGFGLSQWHFPGASPDTSSEINPLNICYSNPGAYDVTLIMTNAGVSDTITLPNYITVYPNPPAQSITQIGDTLLSIPGAVTYQWYYNGNAISGGTEYFYVATQNGDYNVVATDSNGCEVEAVINDVLAHTPLAFGHWSITIYPNPVTSTMDIRGLENNSDYEITIFNVFGEKVFSAVDWKLGTVNCELFPSGVYYLEISSDKKVYRTKFIKSAYR